MWGVDKANGKLYTLKVFEGKDEIRVSYLFNPKMLEGISWLNLKVLLQGTDVSGFSGRN